MTGVTPLSPPPPLPPTHHHIRLLPTSPPAYQPPNQPPGGGWVEQWCVCAFQLKPPCWPFPASTLHLRLHPSNFLNSHAHRNRNSDALGRELREAPLTRLWGHFLAATHREWGPLSPPFTTRVAEGSSACSMVFHGVFRPAWASPPFRWRDAPGLSG